MFYYCEEATCADVIRLMIRNCHKNLTGLQINWIPNSNIVVRCIIPKFPYLRCGHEMQVVISLLNTAIMIITRCHWYFRRTSKHIKTDDRPSQSDTSMCSAMTLLMVLARIGGCSAVVWEFLLKLNYRRERVLYHLMCSLPGFEHHWWW